MLDPQARALLDLLIERRVPPLYSLPPDEARRVYRERRFVTQPDPPEVGAVEQLAIPARDGATLGARLYRPMARPEGLQPALLYLHGGGWVVGDLDTHDTLCRQLCVASGVAVLAVDYRLGPAHRFPQAVHDADDALRWLFAQARALGLDPARIAVGGDSAGGNLSAVACLLLRDRPAADDARVERRPAFQLLIYPATDMRCVHPSHQHNGDGYLLTRELIAWFRGHYIEAGDWADWRASPLLAERLDGLPPALVLTAGYDPLRDEGSAYADRLSAAGVPAQLVCFERQIHGFITMGRLIDEAHTAVALCAAVLARALRA
jgi:acetyl esterase